MTRIILASNSPRRAALLRQLGLTFEIMSPPSNIEINQNKGWVGSVSMVIKLVRENALAKAKSVEDDVDEGLIISGDTIILSNTGEVLGKPQTPELALQILKKLVGRWHRVISAVAIIHKTESFKKTRSGHFVTRVKFREITEDALVQYIDSGEPLDKAGAYAIQGLGGFLVSRISGSHSGIVGLPLELVIKLLEDFDVKVWEEW